MNVICSVCTKEFVSDDNVFITRCGHIFHKDCLFNWLDGTNTCPECFLMCTTSDVHRLFLSFATSSVDEDALDNIRSEIQKAKKISADQFDVITKLRQDAFETLVDQKNLEKEIDCLCGTTFEVEKQIKDLKEKIKQKSGIKRRLAEVESLELVQKILKINHRDVDDMLTGMKSDLSLAKAIVVLEHEKKVSADNGKAIRLILRESQQANIKLNAENRELQGKIDVLKSKNYKLWDNLITSQNSLLEHR